MKSAFKNIPATCFNVNAKGEVRGRDNLAKIYPDKDGNVYDNNRAYHVATVVKELFV